MTDREDHRPPTPMDHAPDGSIPDAAAPLGRSIGDRFGHVLFHASPAPAMIVDPATAAISDANAAAGRFLGAPASDLIGTSFRALIVGQRQDAWDDVIAAAERGDRIVDLRLQHRDGPERDAQALASRLMVDDQLVLYVVLYDASELRRVSAALTQSEQLHRAMV
ncbi:MAG: PAS domain-containing protein, partial [Dehalococcoidia bacterium]|nr:PAS domain-containing protein [Dehalococcoidia bacterium]